MFSNVIGNQRSIKYFTEAAREGKLAHAYIINGEKGSGKSTLAEFIAEGLLCEKQGPLSAGPCGCCPACKKSRSGNHPDLIHVGHEKENVLTVGEIRDSLIADIDIKPFYGPYKIYIIEDAQLMNDNAQNALLKSIEEPPEYGIIFLLTENEGSLLETVRSRCIRLDMEMLSAEEIMQNISAEGIPKEKLQAAAAFSGGNLGRAKAVLSDENLSALIGTMTDLLPNISNADAALLYSKAAEIEKSEQADAIEIIRKWYRDVLFIKACGKGTGAESYFPAERAAEEKMARKMSYEDINEVLAALDIAQRRLKANVKSDAVFETLFFALRRCAGGHA